MLSQFIKGGAAAKAQRPPYSWHAIQALRYNGMDLYTLLKQPHEGRLDILALKVLALLRIGAYDEDGASFEWKMRMAADLLDVSEMDLQKCVSSCIKGTTPEEESLRALSLAYDYIVLFCCTRATCSDVAFAINDKQDTFGDLRQWCAVVDWFVYKCLNATSTRLLLDRWSALMLSVRMHPLAVKPELRGMAAKMCAGTLGAKIECESKDIFQNARQIILTSGYMKFAVVQTAITLVQPVEGADMEARFYVKLTEDERAKFPEVVPEYRERMRAWRGLQPTKPKKMVALEAGKPTSTSTTDTTKKELDVNSPAQQDTDCEASGEGDMEGSAADQDLEAAISAAASQADPDDADDAPNNKRDRAERGSPSPSPDSKRPCGERIDGDGLKQEEQGQVVELQPTNNDSAAAGSVRAPVVVQSYGQNAVLKSRLGATAIQASKMSFMEQNKNMPIGLILQPAIQSLAKSVVRRKDYNVGQAAANAFLEMNKDGMGDEKVTLGQIFVRPESMRGRSSMIMAILCKPGVPLFTLISDMPNYVKSLAEFKADMIALEAMRYPLKKELRRQEGRTKLCGPLLQDHVYKTIEVSGLGNLVAMAGEKMIPFNFLMYHIKNASDPPYLQGKDLEKFAKSRNVVRAAMCPGPVENCSSDMVMKTKLISVFVQTADLTWLLKDYRKIRSVEEQTKHLADAYKKV
eukprot:g8514.t1